MMTNAHTLEIYTTDDGSVTKYVHADGSETAIKCVPSQSTFIDRGTGSVSVEETDRNKYSIFISSSVGCYLKCPMCHLTIKDSVYQKLQAEAILANLKQAVECELKRRPELADKYVKICWMGMGDALNTTVAVSTVTLDLLDWMFDCGYTKGLDSVDLSTVMPNVSSLWIGMLSDLNVALSRYPHNPDSALLEQAELSTHRKYATRSSFRLFYSLHSAIQDTRDRIAPNTAPIKTATAQLLRFKQESGCDVIFHQLFVEGLNDLDEEVVALANYINDNFPDHELRVLRYNSCDKSTYHEWSEVDKAVQYLARNISRLKVQISAGKEVQAACGQFLVSKTKSYVKLHAKR